MNINTLITILIAIATFCIGFVAGVMTIVFAALNWKEDKNKKKTYKTDISNEEDRYHGTNFEG